MRTQKREAKLSFDFRPKTAGRRCDHPGCQESGEFRAPKSRNQLREYYWFCLDHVREYNKSWNYYAGLSDLEIERMVRFDTVWNRQTWPMGGWRAHEERLRAALDRDFGPGDGHRYQAPPRPAATTEEGRALAELDLTAPVEFAEIKARYKALVKEHHPDANGGSKESEEKLKSINRAFGILKASFAS